MATEFKRHHQSETLSHLIIFIQPIFRNIPCVENILCKSVCREYDQLTSALSLLLYLSSIIYESKSIVCSKSIGISRVSLILSVCTCTKYTFPRRSTSLIMLRPYQTKVALTPSRETWMIIDREKLIVLLLFMQHIP